MRATKIAVLAALLSVAPAIAQDPVTVNPHMVKVEFENEQIRVLRVHYTPQERFPMHSHPGYVVILVMGRVRMPDGTMQYRPVNDPGGGAIWSDKVTHESEIYEAPAETIEIEIKRATVPAVEVRPNGEVPAANILKEPVPVELEPHHHVFFQNQYVRVLDVFFPVGEPALFHTHSNDNVSIELSGDKTKSQAMGGEWSAPGDVVHGRVAFHKAHGQPYTHRVGSAGEKPFHVIDVEIFPDR